MSAGHVGLELRPPHSCDADAWSRVLGHKWVFGCLFDLHWFGVKLCLFEVVPFFQCVHNLICCLSDRLLLSISFGRSKLISLRS
jgi:hypothetical protein